MMVIQRRVRPDRIDERLHVRRTRRILGRFCNNTAGATAVEMAFAVPVFLIFLIGFIGLTHAFWIYNSMMFAADQGGRYAMLHPTATDSEIDAVVRSHLYGISTTPLTVIVTDDTSGTVDKQTIALSYAYSFISSSYASALPTTLTASVTVPVVP